MQARETTFQQLVQGEKQFQVPLYQRTYSWKEPQLQQLWSDVLDQAEELRVGHAGATHFLGSVVLAPSPLLTPGGLQRWLVVDGQQRLTTLMVALCALRDHAATEDPSATDRYNDRYLLNRYQKGDGRFRLSPTQADRGAFVACVTGAPGAGAGDGIGAAYRWFRQAIAAADEPEDLEDITRIEAVIRERLALVEIVAHHDDNVHRIFESLNNTGLGLAQADLLRNYLFMLLPNRGEELYTSVWLPLQERLSTNELEQLLYLDLVLHGDEQIRRDELYRAQQRRLEPMRADEAALETELRALDRRSRHLERLLRPAAEPDARLRRIIDFLRRWEATTTYPVLMRLLDLQARERATTDEIVDAARILEGFLVRRMLAGTPTQGLNRAMAAAAQELSGDEPVAEQLRRLLSAPRRRWPTDAELSEAILTRPFYWSGRPVQRNLVLRQLEASFGSGEPVDYEVAKLSIEHVLPQTPTAEWLDDLAHDVVDEAGPEELHGLLVHTLGNLTLTAYNSSLSNLPFRDKRQRLRESAFLMNQAIAAEDRWGRAQIEARGKDLSRRAINLWPGPLPRHQATASSAGWTMLRQALAALPAGSWTTYGDVAELIGSHPVPVGSYLARERQVNAHRVLTSNGAVSPMFQWLDDDDDRSPVEVLQREGVAFGASGRADPAQRMSAQELADLIGLARDEVGAAPDVTAVDQGDRYRTFQQQLAAQQPGDVVAAVEDLLRGWRQLSGLLEFGAAAETSCFLMLRRPTSTDAGRRWWPLTVYPSGGIEVQFQHLRDRPPWDSEPLRDQFRHRLNEVEGVAIDAVKLTLRPSIPLSALLNPGAVAALLDALEWFALTTEAALDGRG